VEKRSSSTSSFFGTEAGSFDLLCVTSSVYFSSRWSI